MASPTARLGLRVLEGADAADVPADLNQVTGILDHAAIDVGQGGFSGVPAAGTQGRYYHANDRRQLLRDNGASWDVVGHATPPKVTSLPTTGLWDGLEVLLRVTTGPNTYWHLMYVAGNAAGKRWVPVGVTTPLQFGSGESAVADSTVQGSWAPLDWGLPISVAVPVAGDYDVEWGANLLKSPSGYGYAMLKPGTGTGSTVIAGGDSTAVIYACDSTAGVMSISAGHVLRLTLTAGDLYLKGVNTVGTWTARSPYLRVTPVAIGG